MIKLDNQVNMANKMQTLNYFKHEDIEQDYGKVKRSWRLIADILEDTMDKEEKKLITHN